MDDWMLLGAVQGWIDGFMPRRSVGRMDWLICAMVLQCRMMDV
jgi:hypothetical protein